MIGNNIAGNWERSHFETFMERLNETRKWAQKALKAEEEGEAIELWQKIFGEEHFPSSIEEDAKTTASLLKTGAFVSTTGHIIPEKATDIISTKILPHRSYGK
jgi:hypothetical protein